jgi:hypothetical protein
MHVAIVDTAEVSTESQAFHLPEKGWMGGKHIFKWAMLFAGLAHQNASRFFQYLGLNNSGPVPKIRYSSFAFDDSLRRFSITLRAQGLSLPGHPRHHLHSFPALQQPARCPSRLW